MNIIWDEKNETKVSVDPKWTWYGVKDGWLPVSECQAELQVNDYTRQRSATKCPLKNGE